MDRPPALQVQRECALCAIAAAGSRFIPLPLVDDLVKDRATRTAVARIWYARGRAPDAEVVAILCGDTLGTLAALGRGLRRLPLIVVLFPFRKVRLLLTAVQGVSDDLLQVLLLARVVDRYLAAGWFDVDERAELLRRARLVRRAHDRTVRGADLRTLRLLLGSALRQISGLTRQARDYARQAFGRSAPAPDGTTPVPGTDREQVGSGADRVQAVLGGPEALRILHEFDARFDAALAALAALAPATPGTSHSAAAPGTAPG